MNSENARFLRQGLVDRFRKMTPAERVSAFIEHSRLMIEFKKAGEARRRAGNAGNTLNAS